MHPLGDYSAVYLAPAERVLRVLYKTDDAAIDACATDIRL